MKIIEVIVSATGQAQVETKGFVGAECCKASEFVEGALGRKTSERLTGEFYEQQSQRPTTRENA